MSPLQPFIVLADLANQLFIAREDSRGYLAWVAGSIGLMSVYWETKQFTLIVLQFINTGIQVMALIAWR